jgi:Lysine methyltransferase
MMNNSMKMVDILSGQSSMRSQKYQRVAHGLQWRQKYMKCSHYELSMRTSDTQLDKVAIKPNNESINDETKDIMHSGVITIRLRQIDNGELKGLGTGTFVWPAAHVLSKYLENNYSNRMIGMNICDLGSGTGTTREYNSGNT